MQHTVNLLIIQEVPGLRHTSIITSLHYSVYSCLFNLDEDTAEMDDYVTMQLVMNVKKQGMMGRFCHSLTPFGENIILPEI